MTEIFGNFATVVGKVYEKQMKEINGEEKLGNLTLQLGDAKAYCNIWNPKKANTNKVKEFFSEIEKGDTIQLRGSIEEDFYDGEYRRRVNVPVSAQNGVNYTLASEGTKKYVAAISGNVVNMDFEMETDLAQFDDDTVEVMYLTLAIFNLYNPDDPNEDLSKKEVLVKELKNYKEYIEGRDNTPENEIKTVKKLIKKVESETPITNETLYGALKKFVKIYQPRMWNIDILHLKGYKSIAEELAEVDLYDNVSVGVQINNMRNVDEFGFVDGYINEIEIKKIKEINKQVEDVDDDFFGDDFDDDLDDFGDDS